MVIEEYTVLNKILHFFIEIQRERRHVGRFAISTLSKALAIDPVSCPDGELPSNLGAPLLRVRQSLSPTRRKTPGLHKSRPKDQNLESPRNEYAEKSLGYDAGEHLKR